MNFTRWLTLIGALFSSGLFAAEIGGKTNTGVSFIIATNGPAYRTAARFQRGVNLGNYLEVAPGHKWGVAITTNDFEHIKAEGFDHIRVPIGWHHYAGPAPEFKLSDEIFNKVDFVLTNALSRNLAVMLNLHHFNEFTDDPARATPEFLAIWRQVGAHYAAMPQTVIFELLNEATSNATTVVINPIFRQAIAEIRKTNPQRTIVVGPGGWNSIDELKNLVLPEDDNLLVTVHCYDPFYFTHQGASWGGPEVITTGVVFPGPPEKPIVLSPTNQFKSWVSNWFDRYDTLPTAQNPSSALAFAPRLALARAWSEQHGRPIYIGEFGAYTKADPVSRANFYRAFRQTAEREKFGWAAWDWNSDFRYWNEQKNAPEPGMHAALFQRVFNVR